MLENIKGQGIVENPGVLILVIETKFGPDAWAIEKEIVSELKARFDLASAESGSLPVIISTARASRYLTLK